MDNPFDQLAKRLGKQALDACGTTTVQHEIARAAQQADLRHEPDPDRRAERERLGLLGRVAAVLCLIEVFAHPPDAGEIRACLIKHLVHWEEQQRRARARNRALASQGWEPQPAVEPYLWIIAAGLSDPMRRKLAITPAPGWPPGVYLHGGPWMRVRIIIAGELPRDRSTLLVRIMAAGPLLLDAVAELAALPGDAYERAVAEDVLLYVEGILGARSGRTEDEEEFVMTMGMTFTQGARLARLEGAAEARARDVITVLRVRGLALPDAARERIAAERDPVLLERWLEKAILASSVDEVLGDPS